MKRPELLSPAGNLRNLRFALAYGADAVYAGLPRYSLRVRNNDFRDAQRVSEGIALAHAAGRQFFLAVNGLPHDAKIRTFLADMAQLLDVDPAQRPDALIMADPGLIHMIRERWPEAPIHLSVQANTMNAMAVKFWQSVGLTRIILSRELSLTQIEQIRQQCPDIELEVFVHGALCIAHSGRCLLSGYFNHRDANQGTCTNACRWDYRVSAGADEPDSASYFLEEASRPGEFMPIEEDEHGTYIMNSKDLRAVEHVDRLVRIGVDCLKIEGRTKSHYYTASATAVYRQAIDDAMAGKPLDLALIAALDGLANRGYTDGFLQRHPPEALQNYLAGASRAVRQQFCGELSSAQAPWADEDWIAVEVKNKFRVGDELSMLTPGGSAQFRLETMRNTAGDIIEEAPGAGHTVHIRWPAQAGERHPQALLARCLSA